MSNPLHVLTLREQIKDGIVVEEFDRLIAFLRGALYGVGHVDLEAALELGEDNGPVVDIPTIDTGAFPTLSGTGHPQGVVEAAIGSIYVDTNTGYRFQKIGGAATAYGWYYVSPAGTGIGGYGPQWFGMQVHGGSLSTTLIGPFGELGTKQASVTPTRTYVTGQGWYETLTTAASSGSAASVGTALQPQWWTDDFDFVATIRTGADLTNSRIWMGFGVTEPGNLSGEVPAGTTVNSASIYVRYLASADSEWKAYTHNGVDAAGTATALGAIAASTTYKLRIRFIRTGTPTAYFSIDDGTEISQTATIPATGLAAQRWLHLLTRAAEAKSFSWRSLHVAVGAQS